MRVKRWITEALREPVLQPTCDLEILHRQGQLAQSRLRKFGNALAAEIGSEFELADLKDLSRCFEKVAKKYNGDASHLHDIARGRIPADNIAKIHAAERILNPERRSPFLARMAELGYFVRQYENLFESPSASGVRGIDVKLEIPLTHGSFHIGELHIRHPGMEPAYAESHSVMEQQRGEYQFDPCAKEVSPEYAAEFNKAVAARRVIHDVAAIRLGLDILEKSKIDAAMRKFDIAA